MSPDQALNHVTEEERSRLRSLCEAATPGPWGTYEWWGMDDHDGGHGVCTATPKPCALVRTIQNGTRDDVALIAAARTAVPSLLDALDHAERQRDEARAEVGRWRTAVRELIDAQGEDASLAKDADADTCLRVMRRLLDARGAVLALVLGVAEGSE